MKNQKQAFTLVELIVVIVILAILGTIAFISLQGYSASSRDSVRISDVSTLKTALGVFHVGSGKYPLPDNGEQVSYSGTTLRTQGTIGETVIKNLSRSMKKIPTDPSSSMEYVYSVTSTQNEYEILNLLEGDITYKNTNLVSAMGGKRITKISGSYNGLYIKTPTLIFPTPSIINSEPIIQGAGLVIDNQNIKSQVIEGGENIPNVGGNITTKTGTLDIKLSVYNGTINKDSTDQQKIDAIKAIQGAYSGTSFATIGIYKVILDKITEEELVAIADNVILSKASGTTSNNGTDSTTVIQNCGSGTISGIDNPGINYEYLNTNSGETSVGTGTELLGGTLKTYVGDIKCNDGEIIISNEALISESCIYDECLLNDYYVINSNNSTYPNGCATSGLSNAVSKCIFKVIGEGIYVSPGITNSLKTHRSSYITYSDMYNSTMPQLLGTSNGNAASYCTGLKNSVPVPVGTNWYIPYYYALQSIRSNNKKILDSSSEILQNSSNSYRSAERAVGSTPAMWGSYTLDNFTYTVISSTTAQYVRCIAK